MSSQNDPHALDHIVKGYKGAPQPLRLLAHDASKQREIIVAVTPDNLHAFVKVIRGVEFDRLTREEVVSVAAQSGVVFNVVDEGIKLLIHMVSQDEPFSGFFEVAQGTPPQRGEDGTIEFHVLPTTMNPRYDQDDDGGIDYKQPNLIENCFVGQRVASILPPGPGRRGRDVFGDPINPQPGRPLEIAPGVGIQVSANGREFTSEIEGRLVYENNELSISPTLEINRDIDYAVGNIDFVGKVVIKGNLLDGFYVNAKRGVELLGDVGAGRIISEGDVSITGGIKGRNAALIACRNLKTRYIDDASVEAMGDVLVTKEIMNSSVKALGRVTVTSGAIIGGVVCGFRGVEADTLGSDMGVTTRVIAGLNWTEENLKDDIRMQMAEYMERAQSAKMILDQLFNDKELSARLGTEQKIMLSDIAEELREIRELMQDLLEERSRIDTREQVGMVNQINVRKTIYMGVTIQFSEADVQIKDTLKGPASLLQSRSGREMETRAMVALPKLSSNQAKEGSEKDDDTVEAPSLTENSDYLPAEPENPEEN